MAGAYLHAKLHPDPSNRLATIHQRHRETDRQTGQRSDSIGRTVLQTVAQKSHGSTRSRMGVRKFVGGPVPVQCCVVVGCSVDAHDHIMSGVADGPRPSVDGTGSPPIAFFSGTADALATQQSTGARRGSFLFRCESDDRGDHHPASGMVISASAARLNSLLQANQLHEMFVLLSYAKLYFVDYYHLRHGLARYCFHRRLSVC